MWTVNPWPPSSVARGFPVQVYPKVYSKVQSTHYSSTEVDHEQLISYYIVVNDWNNNLNINFISASPLCDKLVNGTDWPYTSNLLEGGTGLPRSPRLTYLSKTILWLWACGRVLYAFCSKDGSMHPLGFAKGVEAFSNQGGMPRILIFSKWAMFVAYIKVFSISR